MVFTLQETRAVFQIAHFHKYTPMKCIVYTQHLLEPCTKSYRVVLSQVKH